MHLHLFFFDLKHWVLHFNFQPYDCCLQEFIHEDFIDGLLVYPLHLLACFQCYLCLIDEIVLQIYMQVGMNLKFFKHQSVSRKEKNKSNKQIMLQICILFIKKWNCWNCTWSIMFPKEEIVKLFYESMAIE